ncbi:hypothetical protein [Mangrovibacterium marinum]|uniref:hypothetical protein n=1 Tax=Mangrovibacterium marinum TaxID=1639118 RepID=UPI001473F921|nr:hypothetical protein [Mangrovibacterium marinum]
MPFSEMELFRLKNLLAEPVININPNALRSYTLSYTNVKICRQNTHLIPIFMAASALKSDARTEFVAGYESDLDCRPVKLP